MLFHLSAFDLVNIHLFHDASNLVAWEKSPSVYSGTRQKALGFVLDRYGRQQSPGYTQAWDYFSSLFRNDIIIIFIQ